jgi:hypothetical protein
MHTCHICNVSSIWYAESTNSEIVNIVTAEFSFAAKFKWLIYA